MAVTLDDLTSVGKRDIKYFKTLLRQFYHCTAMYNSPKQKTELLTVDLLWKMSLLLKPTTPMWNGFMQMVQCGSYPEKSSVLFMSMIDSLCYCSILVQKPASV